MGTSSSSSSSSSSVEVLVNNGVVKKYSIIEAPLNTNFSAYYHSNGTSEVFGPNSYCASSTGKMDGDLGRFVYQPIADSHLDFPTAYNRGGPVEKVTLTLLFSNGTDRALPMEVRINGARAIDYVEFPPTGNWNNKLAFTIETAGNTYSSTLQLSFVAKSELGGPSINLVNTLFSFNCNSATGCGNTNPPASTCP